MKAILVLVLTFSASVWGATSYRRALDKKINQYLTEGVVVGGESGAGFSLLGVRRDHSKKLGMERIVLDLGDRDGKPLINRLPYFHVSVEPKKNRLVVDLAQVRKSRIDEKKFLEIMRRSPYVKTASMTFDGQDQTTNLTLEFKRPIRVEVFEMPSSDKASRLVLDVRPLVAKRRN